MLNVSAFPSYIKPDVTGHIFLVICYLPSKLTLLCLIIFLHSQNISLLIFPLTIFHKPQYTFTL